MLTRFLFPLTIAFLLAACVGSEADFLNEWALERGVIGATDCYPGTLGYGVQLLDEPVVIERREGTWSLDVPTGCSTLWNPDGELIDDIQCVVGVGKLQYDVSFARGALEEIVHENRVVVGIAGDATMHERTLAGGEITCQVFVGFSARR